MDGDSTPPLATGSMTTPSVSPVATDADPEHQASAATSTTSGHGNKSKKKWKGFSKMKNPFSKKKSTTSATEDSDTDDERGDEPSEITTRSQFTASEPPSSMTPTSLSMASPGIDIDGDVLPLKPAPQKQSWRRYVTFGNFISALLIFVIFLGIFFCFLILVDSNYIYIGPMALGLGTFALIGKLYYTSFWWGKQGPALFRPVTNVYEKYLGGVKDPYNKPTVDYTGQYYAPPGAQPARQDYRSHEMQPMYSSATHGTPWMEDSSPQMGDSGF